MIKRLLPALLLVSVPAMNTLAQAPVSSQQDSTEQRLQRIERMLDSQGLLDMLQQLQQLQQEISMLRGEIETQNYNLGQLTR
ncbi:MAG: YbgF trimerization domain-containing protein, partial [Gammaproteobacteria bacterium]